MKIKYISGLKYFSAFLLMGIVFTANANTSLTLNVLGEEFTLQHYPATGNQLVLYVAPNYGFNERGTGMAQELADLGIEVWMVDLVENLFLTHSSESLRTFDGRYVANIIEQAHAKSGKNITLLTSSYGAIPVLRGARQWQLNNPKLEQVYLNGAVMFSPELYRGIPSLGEDPEFEPIASATNIPVMIYQSELRNNRWQLDKVVEQLERSHAVVYQKILPNIGSFFYRLTDEPDAETKKTLHEVPLEMPRVIKMLESTPTPLKAAELGLSEKKQSTGLDTKLKKYKGNRSPLRLDLENINGERIVRTHFRGKVTVVNFWATWCPPCVEEIPMLNRLKSEMKGSNFEILSVNYGEGENVIREFLKMVRVEFPVLLDDKGRTSGDWNTIVLPSTYVIGPDGKFAYAVNAAIEWDSHEVIKTLRKLAGE